MRKVSILIVICLLLSSVIAFAQTQQLAHVDFESGIPSGWTVSSTSNITINTALHATGQKCLRMQPSANEITLTSPVYNITVGCATRLEFSHIPMLNNVNGGRVEVKKPNGTWVTLMQVGAATPSCYDPSYGAGIQMNGFNGEFFKAQYWNGNTNVTNLDSSYWRNEIFYLASTLGTAASSFQIRFVLPVSTGSAANWSGWYLDDIRLFVASSVGNEVRVPQIKNFLMYPSMQNYPNCGDAEVSLEIKDAGGAMTTIADSIYIEYYTEGDHTLRHTDLLAQGNNIYTGYIPFAGLDSVIFWRAVINDLMSNKVTYPFVYGTYSKFKSIRPYVGNNTIQTNNTSSQELVLKTNMKKAMYQMRYSASELRAAGFGAGKIGGLSMNLTTSAAGTILPGFHVYIGNIDTNTVLDEQYQYTATPMMEVYNNISYVVPSVGWTYIPFDTTETFLWDGVSDIIIRTCFGESTTTAGATKVESIPASGQYITRCFESSTAIVEACGAPFNASNPTISYKPNFKFNFVNTCFFKIDAGIDRITLLLPQNAVTCTGTLQTTGLVTANTPTSLRVNINNDGTDTLHSVRIKWMLDNNTTQVNHTDWYGAIPPSSQLAFTTTTSLTVPEGFHTLTVWSEMISPDTVDWNFDNDTAVFHIISTSGPMSGNYAIGGTVSGVTANRTFDNFDQAFTFLVNSGVNGPVVFKISTLLAGSYYTNNLVFPNCVNGVSTTNTVTFTSATPLNPAKFYNIAPNTFFNLAGVKYFNFESLDFLQNPYTTGGDMIGLTSTSSDIKIKKCRFMKLSTDTPIGYMNSQINIGAANNVDVDSCSFLIGDIYHIYIKGTSPTNMNKNINITNSTFQITGQTTTGTTRNAIYSEYNKKLVISKNTFTTNLTQDIYTTFSGVKYAVMLQNSDSLNVNKNMFELLGTSAIALSNVNNSNVANNKISIDQTAGSSTAGYSCYGLNLLSGQNNIIAYNNLYGKANVSYDKKMYGLSLGSLGQTTLDNIVKNNIVVSDGYGYAVSLRPSETNAQQSFDMANNLYYKTTTTSLPLFSYNGATNTTVAAWILQSYETNSYYDQNPIFTAWNNLSTSNTFLCEKGIYLTAITDDFFGNARPLPAVKAPCIGAVEFNPPPSNIFVSKVGVLNGNYNLSNGVSSYTGCDFGNDSVFVTFKNISSNVIPANTLHLSYSVNNSTPSTVTYTSAVQPDTLYTFVFPTTHNFAATTANVDYSLVGWSSLSVDTIHTNDTAFSTVHSLYQLPAMATINSTINYGDSTLVSVTSNDSIYWFYNTTNELPFLKSHSFETPRLYSDTSFYFSRKSEIPVLKITEIQLTNNSVAEGQTVTSPSWASSTNIYEISNFGNGDINLTGYKFCYVTGSALTLSNNMTKTYTFPDNYILHSNTSICLLNVNANNLSAPDSLALAIGTGTVGQTSKAGFIIKDSSNNIVDAVTINGSTFNTATNVPTTVWSGASTNLLTQGKAGIYRISNTATTEIAWAVSSSTNPLTIGTMNSNLIVATDNGCYGYRALYNIHVNGVPSTDPGIASVSVVGVNDTAACTLTNEQIKVKITNTGVSTLNTPIPLVCHLYEGNTLIGTIIDTFSGVIPSFDTVDYTLNGTLNFTANTANRYLTIEVYTNSSSDVIHLNDTATMNITSRITPITPTASNVTIPYATNTTLTATSNDVIIWYNDPYTAQELSRTTYTTPTLYQTDTFYVGSLLQQTLSTIVGNGTAVNAPTAYPAPLNCVQKQVKEQYLIRASELDSLGVSAGNINDIAFHISAVTVTSTITKATLLNYNIRVGVTNDTALSTWESGLTTVYNIDTLRLTTADTGWRTFAFTSPYYWDGVSNLLVEVCFSSPNTSTKVQTYCTQKTYNSAISYRNANVNACSWTGNPSSVFTKIPNMKFGIDIFGCQSVRQPVVVTVLPPPSCDAGLVEVVSPSEQTVMSGVQMPIEVVLKNFGVDTLTSATINWSINGVNQTPYAWTGSLAENASDTVQIGTHAFSSGEITLMANVVKACDTINSNDTITSNFSACIGNNNSVTTLTISNTDATADYPSFTSAINALAASGICGPVVFNVASGTYQEQVNMPTIIGSSSTNTITFQGQGATKPIITFAAAATDETQYALNLDGATNVYFNNIEVLNNNATYPVAVHIINTENINFSNMLFTSPSTATTTTTLVQMEGINSITNFVRDTFSSGSQSLVTSLMEEDSVSTNLKVDSCFFNYFGTNAVVVNSYDGAIISHNKIRAYTSTLIGSAITFKKVIGTSKVEANDIYMNGGTAVRKGIDIKNSTFDMINPLLVINNAVSLTGTATNSNIAYIGLDVDTSNYVYIYYNTIRVQASNNSSNSKTVSIGASATNVNIRNNNFENAGKGYVYYVTSPGTQVSISNNNNYVVNGTRFAFWGANIANLGALRTANNLDLSSDTIINPFVSDSNLSLLYPTEIVRNAEPLDDVPMDILGNYRPVSPRPTMGAYEYIFTNVDAGITNILDPLTTISYVENDPLTVKVRVKNFGNYSIDTINLTAVMKYHEADATPIQTFTEQYVGFITSLDTVEYTFTNTFTPPLNTPLTDSLCLYVYTTLQGDTVQSNDTSFVKIKVLPAKNLQVVKTNAITERCKLLSQPVSAVLKNVGEKPITDTDNISLTYEVEGRPDLTVTEQLHLPYTDETGTYPTIQKNAQITYTFTQSANLYPLGLNDTTWRMRTYATFTTDHVKTNDTSAYITINSRRSPNPPVAYNDTIPYGTWGHPWATQENNLSIKWFADSNSTDPFYSPSAYATSQHYTTTQLFTDSTFYLRVNLTGSYPCASFYTPIHVVLDSRAPVDASAMYVTEPIADGWVYMTTADTIKVKLTNYGTTPLTNFQVSYSIRPTTPSGTTPTIVTETCTAVIQPDQQYVYKFNALADFGDPSKTYEVRSWVDAIDDYTALNDTTPILYVHPKNGNTLYCNPTVTDGVSLDITRVQMATVDNSSLPSESTYSNYTTTVSPIVVFKGLNDSLLVKVEKSSSMAEDETTITQGWMKVYIDWNRNGEFDTISPELVYEDTVYPNTTNRAWISIPANTINGYTRMRIMLSQDDSKHEFGPCSTLAKGEIEDYKILVRTAEANNAELMYFTAPDKFLSEAHQDIKVKLRNVGTQPLTAATITWSMNGGAPNTYSWSGNLLSSQSQEVTLGTVDVPLGNNTFDAYVDALNDNYHVNDTIHTSAYIFHVYPITYTTDFDTASNDDFYAFESNPNLPTNCWEFGTPDSTNTVIRSAYSTPNCWKTKLSGNYPQNTESILYSPIYNIGIIKPDTLKFMMRKAMGNGARMVIEYRDYHTEPHWVKLGAVDDGYGTNWYNNDDDGFTGTNAGWQQVSYSLDHITGLLGNTVQFRFIFRSGNSTPANGVAIDNFTLKRGLRDKDLGVVALEVTPLALPNYGAYFYPKAKIYNFGRDTVTSFKVCYMSAGMYIPQCEDVMGAHLYPGDTMEYTFTAGRYLDVNMPDPFSLCAFTRLNPTDIYSDNDTTCIAVVIGPLEKDAAILSVVEPTDQIVANDDVEIAIQIKNYGLQPITSLPVGYTVSGGNVVNETITFNPPLYNGDEYVYRFNQRYHASFGTVNLKTWVGLDGDYYHDNDTIYKRLEGTNTTQDLEAKYVTIDDANPDDIGVQLAFLNRSSVGVSNVQVGYYVNGDPTTAVVETYRLGNAIPAGTYGYHTFTARLPRSGAPYQSICGFVAMPTETDRSNDTTCTLYMGYRDGVADTVFIEETSASDCLIQLVGHNGGTLGGTATQVTAHIVLNGDFSNIMTQTFTWGYDEPNANLRQYMTFTQRIPKSTNGQYNVVAWLTYPFDAAHWNDTTRVCQVKTYVGLDDTIATNGEFVLEQNKPNPFNQTTTIGFTLPHSGNISLYIMNSVGQIVYQTSGSYKEGHNSILFDKQSLPQGVYYYVMNFEGIKQSKKMIIIR